MFYRPFCHVSDQVYHIFMIEAISLNICLSLNATIPFNLEKKFLVNNGNGVHEAKDIFLE